MADFWLKSRGHGLFLRDEEFPSDESEGIPLLLIVGGPAIRQDQVAILLENVVTVLSGCKEARR